MSVFTAAGSSIAIGSKQTGLTTDVYTSIGSVERMGEFGRAYNLITFTPLDTRYVGKYKGSINDGTISLEIGFDPDDSGQGDLETALNDDDEYNFRVMFNDASNTSGSHPTIYFFKAKVMDFRHMERNSEAIGKVRATLEIMSGTLTKVAAT